MDNNIWEMQQAKAFLVNHGYSGIDAIVERFQKPVVLLDSFCFVEMAKERTGKGNDTHKKEYGRLRELLSALIDQKRILCPLGYQENEIGSLRKYKDARDTAISHTNAVFSNPYVIHSKMTNAAFLSYIKNEKSICFPTNFIERESRRHEVGDYDVHVTLIQSKQKMNEIQERNKATAEEINALNRNQSRLGYEDLLLAELNGEADAFDYMVNNALHNPSYQSELTFIFFEVLRLLRENKLALEKNEILRQYRGFLRSSHHAIIPYVWIQSTLWAKHRSRKDHIIPSDSEDILWASTYLPYVDYCFTDKAFYALLNSTSLSAQIDTKLYSVQSFNSFLEELELLLN